MSFRVPRFVGERRLMVNGDTITAKRMTVATGSKPAIPSIEGLDKVLYFTNETIFSLEQQPHTLLILGEGAIGLELAQAFARLGTSVQVIEEASQILAREDRERADMLGACLTANGVTLLLGAKETRVVSADGSTQLHATTSDGCAVTLHEDALLVATGQAPNVATLDLAKGAIEANKHGIVVDHTLKTTASDVWAAGDCVGPLRSRMSPITMRDSSCAMRCFHSRGRPATMQFHGQRTPHRSWRMRAGRYWSAARGGR
ncbi:MAG: FAD-dependent oxidoreductase [Gemmatimonadaceae bacterium]